MSDQARTNPQSTPDPRTRNLRQWEIVQARYEREVEAAIRRGEPAPQPPPPPEITRL